MESGGNSKKCSISLSIQSKNSICSKEIVETHKLDEALALTKFGKCNFLLIFVSGLILTTVLLETLGISFILPIMTCDLKLDNKQRGALGAIAFAGVISSSHLWGFLADTRGRRKIIYPALFIACTCSFISSMLTNFYLLIVFRFFVGFFVSSGSATIYVFLGEFHSEKNRSRAIMAASTVFGLGCCCLPAIAWVCLNQEWMIFIPYLNIEFKPWRLYLIVCALPTLLSAIGMFKFPESPKFVFAHGDHDRAVGILGRIYAMNSGETADNYPVKKIDDTEELSKSSTRRLRGAKNKTLTKLLRKMWDQTVPLFKPPLWKRTLVICCLQFGIFVPSTGMYMIFPDILNRISLYTDENPGQQVGICQVVESTSITNQMRLNDSFVEFENCVQTLSMETFEQSLILEILYAGGFALIGLLINKIGKLSILVFVTSICGFCGVASVFILNLQWAIGLYIVFLCCGIAVAVVNAATVDLYPTKYRAMSVCIALMSGRIGSFVGSFSAGTFIESHCFETFTGTGIILMTCGLIAFSIPSISKEQPKPSQDEEAHDEELPDV